jgi:hypothetical protein
MQSPWWTWQARFMAEGVDGLLAPGAISWPPTYSSGISEIAGTPAWHSSRAQSLEGDAECALVIQMACMLAVFEER